MTDLKEAIERTLTERGKKDSLTPRSLEDLIGRLGGVVRIPIKDGLGPVGGDEPDNPLEFVRTWDGPPLPAIQRDAAAVLETVLEFLRKDNAPLAD